MGRIVLQARATNGDKLRLWVCAQNYAAPPTLSWHLDRQPRQPAVVRPLKPTRDLPADAARNFTGVYEFSGGFIQPGTPYLVEVTNGEGDTGSLTCRTLPAEVPGTLEAPFNVLLVSCFHAKEDTDGLAGTLVEALKSELRPHLTLLMGDQVYLDLPTIANFVDDPAWLRERFERSYLENWTGEIGYSKVLRAAPSASLPDDHEYWNNFPHPSPFIGNTYSKSGRQNWQAAAQDMYHAFQQSTPGNLTQALVLDVSPLSFFLLDTRTFRKPDRSQTVDPAMRQQFSDWVTRVIANRQYGVVASGQSFFDEAAHGLAGAAGDRTLANYDDYGLLRDDLLRLVRAGRPALCLTGDVNWGRAFEARERYMGPGKLYEVISSPSSLVTTVGKDQVKHAVDWVHSLLGKYTPWPRHAEATEPLPFPLQGHLQAVKTLHRQKGNHVVMLSFRRSGFGLNLDITYHALPDRDHRTAPLALPTIQFTSLA